MSDQPTMALTETQLLKMRIENLERIVNKQQTMIDRIINIGVVHERCIDIVSDESKKAIDKITDIIAMQGEMIKLLMAEYDVGEDDGK